MKTMLILLLLLPIQAMADWSTSDTVRQSIFTALMVADWGQTRYIAKHPDQYYEKINKILDSQPSPRSVNNYFMAATVAHYAISRYGIPLIMPAINYVFTEASVSDVRAGWQYVSIGFETNMVSRNYRLGINFNF